MTGIKQIFFILVLAFSLNCVYAQEQQDANQKYSNLIDLQQLVSQLRKNNNVSDTVLLTKTIWQILHSFNDQAQAEQLWETALDKTGKPIDSVQLSLLNPKFNTGQVLSNYTNGMNEHRWVNQRQNLIIDSSNIKDFIMSYDDLTIYFNLKQIWSVIIEEITLREDIQWPSVFNDSINFQFIEKQANQNLSNELEITQQLDKSFLYPANEINDDWLANNFNLIDQIGQNVSIERKKFYQLVARFLLNKKHENLSGTFYTWLELLRFLKHQSFIKGIANESLYKGFLINNQQWFESRQSQFLQLNRKYEVLLSMIDAEVNDMVSIEMVMDSTLPSVYELLPINLQQYMQIPFRKAIHDDLEICLNISDEFAPFPQLPIDLNQFYGCVNDLTRWAVVESKTRGLSGSLLPVDSSQAINRALDRPAWQIINTLQAQVSDENCITESQLLANPFEWTLAAESLMWFADRWPAYMQYDFESFNVINQNNYKDPKLQFEKVISEGEKLQKGFGCIQESQKSLFESLFNDIQQQWQQVKNDIAKVQSEFIESNLRPSSDLDLLDTIEQISSYKVQGAVIQACELKNTCGVHLELNPSREIYKLFPKHLLLADQMKLGSLQLCYDNIGWDNRRSTATHLDNDSVANYLGNLSFHIKGFYQDELVFDRKITAKGENLYLFGMNDESVLNKYCPIDIVGEKISTKLKRGTFGLVPNRLTFLTASRADESKILQNNWQQGEEWQDKIVDESSVEVISEKLFEDYKEPVQLAYSQMSTDLQNTIYMALLNKQDNPTESQKTLASSFNQMNQIIEMFSSLYMVFSDDYLSNDEISKLLFGANGLPSDGLIDDWHVKQIGIKQMMLMMDQRLQDNHQQLNQFKELQNWHSISDTLFRLKQYIK